LDTTAADLAAGRVTINDPLPTQLDGETDPAAAEIAVRYAYQHWILIDLDKDLRAKLVEQGEQNRDGLEAGLAAARSIADQARFAIDAVRITGRSGPGKTAPAFSLGTQRRLRHCACRWCRRASPCRQSTA
jgi:hypothetical protein